MHQRFVQADKGMRAAGMPHAPFGWVAVVANPDMRVRVFKLIILNHFVAIADHLQHQQILTVRKHKGFLLILEGVERSIQAVAILVDILIFNSLFRQIIQVISPLKFRQPGGFWAHEILHYERRFNF